ncbi:MAG TPA: TIM barrel protein [Thermoguttaceae bacterium]|nr:TIM barrel protein [Thermoguttaceae bacterium]
MSGRLRSNGILLLLVVCCSLYLALPAVAFGQSAGEPKNPLFAFCMDTHDAKKRTLAQQAEMLEELGFDGAGHVGLDNVAERVRTLDEAGLKLFLIGLRVNLAAKDRPYLAQVKEVLPPLKGRNVAMYVTLVGMKPGDPAGEPVAVPLLRELADLARESGVDVVLYPHTGDWLVRMDHAVQLAEKVDRPNLGVIFNLCHFLRNEDPATLDAVLESARPHLFLVSINGAEPEAKSEPGWAKLIEPLDQGTLDTYGLLKTLEKLDYTGPVALMCYGIGGDAKDHLAGSIAEWRRLQDRLRHDE